MTSLPACTPDPVRNRKLGNRSAWALGSGRFAFASLRPLASLAAAVLMIFPFAGSPAQAFDIFGWSPFGKAEEQAEPVRDPIAYSATLSVGGNDPDLKSDLESASILIGQKDKPPSGEGGLISRALSDRERLVAKLYSGARYGGTVSIRLNGMPLESTVEGGALPGGRPVEVSITVDPGAQFSFGTVTIDTGASTLDTDPGNWGLKAGDFADSGKVLDAEKRIVTDLRNQGYPKARIAERRVTADHQRKTLDVTLAVNPGPRAQFGPVAVNGTEVTDADFVRRQAMLPEGGAYSPERLEAARKRLNDLGIFSSVRFVEGDVDQQTGKMPLTIEVSERKRHVIGAGASWSSTEAIGLESYWRRRNLFGRGELLSVEGSVGRLGSEDFGELDYSAKIAFEKPGIIGPLTKFSTSLGARQENPDAYLSRSVTYNAFLAKEFDDDLRAKAGAEISFSREEDAFGTETYLLAGLPAEVVYDNRDNKLDPTEGIHASLLAEPAYDLKNSSAMLFVRGTVSSYLSLDPADRFVLAGRASAGSILAPSIRSIPASRRLIAGGGGSIRGYAYRNVGPRENGEVTGGRSIVELSGEMRMRVTDTIGLVGFLDAGNAFGDTVPDFSAPLKLGAGAGIRYFTPIGPLRIDAAVPLNPAQDDPDFALYVGLSQAF